MRTGTNVRSDCCDWREPTLRHITFASSGQEYVYVSNTASYNV